MNETALIKKSLAGEKLVNQTREDVFESLRRLLVNLFQVAGQVANTNDIYLIRREIYEDLITRYKSLTLAEFEYCLNRGVRGEYGDYFGINVVTINKWLKVYYHSDERRQALKQNLSSGLALPQRTEPTQAERLEIRKAATMKAFQQFCETGTCCDYGNVAYNYLDEIGQINFSNSEKNGFMQRAGQELKSEAKELKNVFQVKKALDAISHSSTVAKAKHIAINVHFARLKNEGKKLIL